MIALKLTSWYGTLPDWLAAAGTIGAFVAGLRLLGKELETRREALEDRRLAQARMVAAWATEPYLEGESGEKKFALKAYNGSDEPIYEVAVVLKPHPRVLENDPDPGWRMTACLSVGVLGPRHDEVRYLSTKRVSPGPVEISFTDAAGRRWTRFPDGSLVGPVTSMPSVKDRLDAFARLRWTSWTHRPCVRRNHRDRLDCMHQRTCSPIPLR